MPVLCYNQHIMILVAGGTGFIGQALVHHLVSQGHNVRILIRPSTQSPRLPKGIPVEVTVCSLNDERGLRAAMKGVDVVYHLVTAERLGGQADLLQVDIEGTRSISQAAANAHVDRFFFLSHLGADRASAFPVLKAKAIAESYIRQSNVNYTILRSGIVFGQDDYFSTGLANIIRRSPGILLLPESGRSLLQPIWIEDLITVLTWALELPDTNNQVMSIGGPEYITLREAFQSVMETTAKYRWVVPISPAYLRPITVWAEHTWKAFPTSSFWLDYLAADRTCGTDTLPKVFGLLPARFSSRINYLRPSPHRKIQLPGFFNRQV